MPPEPTPPAYLSPVTVRSWYALIVLAISAVATSGLNGAGTSRIASNIATSFSRWQIARVKLSEEPPDGSQNALRAEGFRGARKGGKRRWNEQGTACVNLGRSGKLRGNQIARLRAKGNQEPHAGNCMIGQQDFSGVLGPILGA
jgi:hypothetical protein